MDFIAILAGLILIAFAIHMVNEFGCGALLAILALVLLAAAVIAYESPQVQEPIAARLTAEPIRTMDELTEQEIAEGQSLAIIVCGFGIPAGIILSVLVMFFFWASGGYETDFPLEM